MEQKEDSTDPPEKNETHRDVAIVREVGCKLLFEPLSAKGTITRPWPLQNLTNTTGAALGLASSAGLTRIMTSWLYGTRALDPLTYAAVSFGALAAAATAGYLPARRASTLSPVEALREEYNSFVQRPPCDWTLRRLGSPVETRSKRVPRFRLSTTFGHRSRLQAGRSPM